MISAVSAPIAQNFQSRPTLQAGQDTVSVDGGNNATNVPPKKTLPPTSAPAEKSST